MTRESPAGIDRRTAMTGTITAGLRAALPAAAQTASVAARVDVSQTQPSITKDMYGALIEHIGGLINVCLWAEALDDRKFFYPVDFQPVPAGSRTGLRGPGRKWMPVSKDTTVIMDTAAPYVGEHSPVLTLAGASPRGFQQSGISIAGGKGYSGRIVVAGDTGAQVTVTLIWGDGAGERQSQQIPVGSDWATVALKFAPKTTTTGARLEITGTGSGTFRVGAISLMPDDNLKGFRADTIGLFAYGEESGNQVAGLPMTVAP